MSITCCCCRRFASNASVVYANKRRNSDCKSLKGRRPPRSYLEVRAPGRGVHAASTGIEYKKCPAIRKAGVGAVGRASYIHKGKQRIVSSYENEDLRINQDRAQEGDVVALPVRGARERRGASARTRA